MYFTPYVNDTGIEDPKEYAAQLAKGSMDLRNADLGATVSNIFREKKGDTVNYGDALCTIYIGEEEYYPNPLEAFEIEII